MWLGARRAGTIANALGRNWMVTEQRKAGEGSVCGSPACQAGGRENELETLRNVSRPRTQRVESCPYRGHTTTRNMACSSKDGELTSKICVSTR